ncbi:hypothetical protein C6497_01010 [Candidatus Poribacteria bacterium]|nr:MAG: hypothetical protein C6497_01010 [Candidatus Poribacteria bacterium]
MKRILGEHFNKEQYQQDNNEHLVLECLYDGKQRKYDYLIDNTGLTHQQLIKTLNVLERHRRVKHNCHTKIHLRKYRINWGNW